MRPQKQVSSSHLSPPVPVKATPLNIRKAGRMIAEGKLVAFPTETVYGLGANALDEKAVAEIFKSKGRPSDNPLIVHIADMRELRMVAKKVPPVALKLMKKFWPGPLTFVLSKKAAVPDIVTAGGKTVAVRMPDNNVALALIKAAGCPVAAPSANLAGKPSPTTAAHVAEDLGESVDLILDGGKTRHGLESTVIDVTRKKFEILRTGAVTPEMLAKVLGYRPEIVHHSPDKKGKVKSPGMKYRHYAPSVELVLVAEPDRKKMIAIVERLIGEYHRQGLLVGVLSCKEHRKFYQTADDVVVCGSLKNPATIAKDLYASLRKFKPAMADIVIAENFGSTGIGHAIFDRLSRAATRTIVHEPPIRRARKV